MMKQPGEWACSQCAVCKPLSAFSGQQRRRFSKARCSDCIAGSARVQQRSTEKPTNVGSGPLIVTELDMEQALRALENGLISRSVYLAAFSVHVEQQQVHRKLEHADQGDEHLEVLSQQDSMPTTNSPDSVAVRSLNWGYTRHLDRVFGLRCFSDMISKRLFLNAKDISESMSALVGVQRSKLVNMLPSGKDDVWRRSSIVCIAIGDGITPRTAGLASFMTKWDCTSVDPELYQEWVGVGCKGINRLCGVKGTFEWYFAGRSKTCTVPAALVLLSVHSHHRFRGDTCIEAVRASFGYPPTCLVAIPCCAEFNPTKDVGFPPETRYDDWSIFSQCRNILSWTWPSGPHVIHGK